MSLNNRFQDWLVSIFDSFESSGRKSKLLIALLGIIATIGVWAVHMNYPSYLFHSHGEFRKLAVVIVLAPPFLTILNLAHLLFPEVYNSAKSGLLSAYLQKEKTDRRRQIMILAGMVSALNLLLMIFLTGSAK